jgi:hypothetical protein
MERTEVNLETGEVRVVPLTADEVAEIEARQAEWMSVEEPRRCREKRNALLSTEVDPVVSNPLRWADLSAEKQAEWAAYRRALLDITAQAGFPHDVVWPVAPQ